MARALFKTREGEPKEVIQLVTIKEKHGLPSPGHVLVRMTVCPIHPIDVIYVRSGRLLHPLNGRHPTIGTEGFEIVEERVIPLVWMEYLKTGEGPWQESYVVLPEEHIVACPDGIRDETAVQLFVNPSTTFGLLKDLGVPKGEYILHTAVASALGKSVHATLT